MLFDLRSRGRRRTVQVVYLGLAVLMGGSLVLFGVGAGNGFGGLLNAFTGGGSGSGTSAVTAQEKNALKLTKLHPGDPQAWASLFQARYTAAGQGNDYNANVVDQTTGQTGQYTTAGKQELTSATQAWTHYVALNRTPDSDLAQLAARAYNVIGDAAGEARTWQIVTQANPTTPTYFEYLAAAAYRAKDTHLGDLAAARALALTPKADQATLRTQLQQVKTAAGGTSATAGGAATTGAATTTGPAGASGTITTAPASKPAGTAKKK